MRESVCLCSHNAYKCGNALADAYTVYLCCCPVLQAGAIAVAKSAQRSAALKLMVQSLTGIHLRKQRRCFAAWLEQVQQAADRELRALEGQYFLAQTLGRVA